MSFGKNHSNSNQNTNQNQVFNGTDHTNFNQTDTPTNPGWVDATAQMLNGGLTTLGTQDPHSFIAGADPLQTQAATTAGGLGPDNQPYDAARTVTGYVMNANAPHTGAVQASPYISQYMDPFQNDVINSTLADYDHQAGLTNAQDDLNLAGSGAFGGSGAALTKAATAGELARGRATTESTLRSQGFGQALGAAQSDAQRAQGAKDLNAQLYGQQMDRALGAAGQLGQLSSSQDANTRANIGSQTDIGAQIRQIAQQFAQSPVDFQNALTQLFAGLPTNLFHGDTQAGLQDETQNGTTHTTGTSNGSNTGFGFTIGGGH